MLRALLALSALAVTLSSAPLHAETVVLKPAGPWNLDVGENRCRLNRLFGEQGNQHLLAFEQYYPGVGAGLFMAGPAFKRFSSGAPTELKLFEGQTPLISAPFTGTVEEFGPAVIYQTVRLDGETPSVNDAVELQGSGIPRLAPPSAQARSITVGQGKDAVTFATGSLASAIAALNQCSEDLIYAWGLDLEQHRTATRRAVLVDEQRLSGALMDRFPVELLRSGEQAIIRLRVIVSEEGSVEDCLVLDVASGYNGVMPLCKVMQRARFNPALDAQGQPMRSYYATTVIYEIHSQTYP
jgi:hypothetical protein